MGEIDGFIWLVKEKKTREEAHQEILDKVAEYCRTYHQKPAFEEGQRIPYASRVYDEQEMVNLVDSALEFWLTSGRYTDEFEQKLKEMADKNVGTIEPIYFDMTEEAAVKNAVKKIGRDSQSIDVLVNSAGISIERLFHMTSSKMVEETMRANFFSQVFLAQLVSRYMMKAQRGSIVNIASVTGIEGKQGGLAYGSSKAAVIYSTKTMAKELGVYGIRVNAVSPGFIDTDMWKGRDSQVKEKILSETPLHRQGMPREVANIILFLASDLSSYVTGQNIVADGGRL